MRLNRIELGDLDALDAKPPKPVTIRIELDEVTPDQARAVAALWGKEVTVVAAETTVKP